MRNLQIVKKDRSLFRFIAHVNIQIPATANRHVIKNMDFQIIGISHLVKTTTFSHIVESLVK